MGEVLTMATMRFADEVVAPDEISEILGEETEAPRKAEVDMAKQLIESLSNDFEPSAYKDEYREELLALIERKAKGEAIVETESEAPKPTKAPDLMAALEESLAAVRSEPLGGGEGTPKKKPSSSSSSSSSKKKKAPAKKTKAKSASK
jgi:DNA end-binding protein Ku